MCHSTALMHFRIPTGNQRVFPNLLSTTRPNLQYIVLLSTTQPHCTVEKYALGCTTTSSFFTTFLETHCNIATLQHCLPQCHTAVYCRIAKLPHCNVATLPWAAARCFVLIFLAAHFLHFHWFVWPRTRHKSQYFQLHPSDHLNCGREKSFTLEMFLCNFNGFWRGQNNLCSGIHSRCETQWKPTDWMVRSKNSHLRVHSLFLMFTCILLAAPILCLRLTFRLLDIGNKFVKPLLLLKPTTSLLLLLPITSLLLPVCTNLTPFSPTTTAVASSSGTRDLQSGWVVFRRLERFWGKLFSMLGKILSNFFHFIRARLDSFTTARTRPSLKQRQ